MCLSKNLKLFGFVIAVAVISIAANDAFQSLRLNLSTGIANVGVDGKYGQLQVGSIALQSLATPGAPTVTNVGTTGAAMWSYKIVAKQLDGSYTAAGTAGSTATGNATLTTLNYNHLVWTAVPGAASYDIYRIAHGTTPSTNGKLATVKVTDADLGNHYDDKAAAGDSATAPTINKTGGIIDRDGNFQQLNVSISRTVFLDTNGNDSSGVAGDVSKPVATLAQAKVLASALTPTAANPVKIKASPGTFTITTVSLPNYVSLEGSGIDVTIFTSSINSGPNGCALVPGNSSVISDLTIKATAVSPSYSLAIGNALSQQAFTNAILNRIKVVADTDGLNVTVANSSLTISNSIVVTNWDSVLAYGMNTSVTVVNCQIISDAAGSSFGTSTALARGIRSAGTASVIVYGGSVKCSGSTSQNSSFNTSSNGTLYVYDSTSNVFGTAASDLVREDSTGSLYYSNLTRTDGAALVAINGTPTNLSRNVIRDNNGSDFVSAASTRTNLQISDAGNVKVYRALLTQTGTSAPTATVLENSLGGTVVWTRNSAGNYTATLSGAFTSGKTLLYAPANNSSDISTTPAFDIHRASVNAVTFNVKSDGSQADDYLTESPVEIRVYP